MRWSPLPRNRSTDLSRCCPLQSRQECSQQFDSSARPGEGSKTEPLIEEDLALSLGIEWRALDVLDMVLGTPALDLVIIQFRPTIVLQNVREAKARSTIRFKDLIEKLVNIEFVHTSCADHAWNEIKDA